MKTASWDSSSLGAGGAQPTARRALLCSTAGRLGDDLIDLGSSLLPEANLLSPRGQGERGTHGPLLRPARGGSNIDFRTPP
jgi:predicted esterase